MCGICGVVSRSRVGVSELIDSMATKMLYRGPKSWGMYLSEDDMSQVVRCSIPWNLSKWVYPASITLLHLRAPTGAQEDMLASAHPLQVGSFLLAHNGILLPEFLRYHQDWQLAGLKVDSGYIIGGLTATMALGVEFKAALRHVLSEVEGQHACWLVDASTRMLYLWRAQSPLYVYQGADQIAFSSVQQHPGFIGLEHGVVMQVDMRTLAYTPFVEFTFTSPYQEPK